MPSQTNQIFGRSALFGSVSALGIIAMASNIANADEASRVEALQEQIDTLQQELIDSLQEELEKAREKVDKKVDKVDKEEQASIDERVLGPREMQSGMDQVRLTVSGQVNRGVLLIDDGEDSEAFFVDNDNSSTRIRLSGMRV